MTELYHYGVQGMKWGVRKDTKTSESSTRSKKHFGIDDKGNINLITGKTSSKAKKKFAIKTSLFIGSMSLTVFMMKHPKAVENGMKKCNKILGEIGKKSAKNVAVDSGIYSKSLGRMLTIAEALEMGFDLSD